MLSLLRSLFILVGSGWTFFFRFPTIHLKRFDSRGILLGPWLQAAVFGMAMAAFELFLPVQLTGMIGILAAIVLSTLTGVFHEDGLADVCDSLGVVSYGEDAQGRIQAAMKDSRLGSFGVASLVLLWLFRYEASRQHAIPAGEWVAVIGASRAIPLSLAILGQRVWAGLGQRKVSGLLGEIPTSLAWGTLVVGLTLVPVSLGSADPRLPVVSLLFGVVLALVSWFGLGWLTRRTGGFSGDMAGAFICLSEVAMLLFLLGIS